MLPRLILLAAVLLLSGEAFAEEAKAAVPTCPQYVESGAWVYRYNEWTLEVTPTLCGRNISSEETAYMFYEIARKYSGSPYWTNTRGLINQLTCHYVIARSKPTWNLDPWRPYVGHDNTVAAECNPTTPLPDTPFH